ncbi:MAG TPA: beta-galactosidase [Solirubrobacteraceae bacterium]|nr:beta-galactosidase [Solirubrobacteraceae bacterium]
MARAWPRDRFTAGCERSHYAWGGGGARAADGVRRAVSARLAGGTALVALVWALCSLGPAAASAAPRTAGASEHGTCPADTPSQAAAATPGAPIDVHAIAGNGSVTVSWCPPARGQANVTGYTVTGSDGSSTTASVPNDYVIATAANGTAVSYTVTAHAVGGASGPASAGSNKVTPAPLPKPTHVLLGKPQTVTYDAGSLIIGGKRTFIYSGEFDPWRLPSPSLWLDRLQKMKADGYNAVTPYFDWDYHSPKPGVYDFSGVRDVNLFLNDAQKAGLYVIARPGPYINAETDGGGFPGWLTTQSGTARTDAPDFVAASDQWLSEIDPIIAAHQITRGGDVILYQIENELYHDSPTTVAYMAELKAKVKADGIDVPTTGNESDTFQGTPGNPDIPGYDSYPLGFNCADPSSFTQPPSFSAEPGVPLSLPEFQGGSYDAWGGSGYANCYRLTGPDFENVFYKSNVSQGATIQSNYMGVGDTNWGWLPAPFMYTSYDYGAAIAETGEIGTPNHPGTITGSKYGENKLIGDFLQSEPSLTDTTGIAAPKSTNPVISATARANPNDHTQFVYLRHADATATSTDSTHISLDLGQTGSYTYDDAAGALDYSGDWPHVRNQSYTGGDYDKTESFSDNAGDSLTVKFTGTAISWIAPTANNHGIADVYLDGTQVATVDGYSASTDFQQVEYQVSGLTDAAHTLKIVVSGSKNPASAGTYVSVDAIDVPTAQQASEIYPTVPQSGAITLHGREAMLLVGDDAIAGQQLQYSTSELMTQATIAGTATAVLYGDAGTDGETVLRYASRPTVTALSGHVSTNWDSSRGDLRLDYVHHGLAEVRITGGGRPPLQLLIAATKTAEQFWPESTGAGAALVQGGYLVRTATTHGSTLALTGDTSASGPITVWAPAGVTHVTWNGRPLTTTTNADGSLSATLPGLTAPRLPVLTGWQFRYGTPEAQPGYDDSSWTLADHPTTTNPTKPVTTPVLFADDYGFHQGFIWYRGHFTDAGGVTGITLTAGEGSHGAFSVWINGVFLGSNTSGSENAKQTFDFPRAALRPGGDNVVAVLVQSSGHDEDGVYGGAPSDGQKAPRGLLGAALVGASPTVTWRLQGAQGGENLQDPARGGLNASGLYGTNHGWELPGAPSLGWRPASLADSWARRGLPAGIGWYRTTFSLHDAGGYVPVSLQIGSAGPGPGKGATEFRAFVYVNGWLLGQYDNALGPQHRFYLPAGILRQDGRNTVAVAVWGLTASSGALPKVRLVADGDQSGGVPVADVASPSWNAATYGRPTHATPTLGLQTSTALAQPGQTTAVTATLGNPGSTPLRDASVTLAAPTGWTIKPAGATRTIGTLPPGASARARFRLTAPSSGLTAGPVDLVATAHFRRARDGATSELQAGAQLQVPDSSLAASFDNTGITNESDPQPGGSSFEGFDGEGTTFSAQGLASAGVTPGSPVTAGGLSFTWPNVPPAEPDNTMAQGQIIAVSGHGSTLGFLASSNNSALSGTGTVYYSDGSSQTFTLNIGNFWYASDANGNPSNTTAFSEPTVDYPSGPTSHTVYVFEQSVAIDPGKTVVAVQLPSLGDVSGYNPALHVFGLAIGGS